MGAHPWPLNVETVPEDSSYGNVGTSSAASASISTREGRALRDSRRAPFCWQDVRALDLIRDHFDGRERMAALAVYVAMTECANEQRSDTFTAARARIADKAGTTDRTVDKYAEEFCAPELALLKVERRRTEASHSMTNVWTLLEPLEIGGEAASPGGGESGAGEGGEAGSPLTRNSNVGSGTDASGDPQTSVKKKLLEDEETVFQKWLSLCDRDGYTVRKRELSPSRRRLIAGGLKEATVEECCTALEGLFASSWHKSKGYHDLSHAFGWSPQDKRSLREKIDGHIDEAERAGAGVRRVTSDQEATLARAKDAVRAQAAYPGNDTAQKKGQAAREWLREHGQEVVEPASSDELPTFRPAR